MKNKELLIITSILIVIVSSLGVSATTYTVIYNLTDGSSQYATAEYNDTIASLTPTYAQVFGAAKNFSAGNYTAFGLPDGSYARMQTAAARSNIEPFIRINFYLNPEINYDTINISYYGFENTGEAATCRVANTTAGTVITHSTMPTAAGQFRSVLYRNGAEDTIKNNTNGRVTLHCMGANFDGADRDNISMDYVQLRANYTVYDYTGSGPEIDGTCTTTNKCTVYTPYYNATLKGCAIWNLTWAGSSNYQWAAGGATSTEGIGHLYTTAGVIRTDLTTTTATQEDKGPYVEINCTGATDAAKNYWKFYNDTINLIQNASATYYTGNYFRYAATTGILFNETKNFTAGSLTAGTARAGYVALAFPSIDDYMFAIKFENLTSGSTNTINTSFRTANPPTLAVGRGASAAIPANTLTNLTYAVLLRNESATGDEKYLTILRNFKNPPTGGEEPPADQCTWTGGTWIIENSTCTITIAYNLGKNQWIIKNSTITIQKTTQPFNYSLWWRGLRSTINIKG